MCSLLISRLNGDGFIANETPIPTTGTTSVSTCRSAYCFRRTCGKSVLGTKVLGNAVPDLIGLLYSRYEICVFIFCFRLSFCFPSSSFSNNAARHDLPANQSIKKSINQSIDQSIYNTFGKHGVYHHMSW